MRNSLFILILATLLFSCSDEDKALSNVILSEYLEIHSNKIQDEVIACAGNDELNSNTVYVYYYPITGSSEFQYYETEDVNVDPNDFTNYKLTSLPSNGVLGNKLSRFIRNENNEAWGIVTFLTNGKVHKSNPIRLKQKTIPTEYNTDIIIDNSMVLSPKFTWNESSSMEDVIYFQALVDENQNFISGTYTSELCFRYYNTNNVVLTINEETPNELDTSLNYTMTILGVSEDNWVNVFSVKEF